MAKVLGGSPVKSIQRGYAALSGSTSFNVTISEVDLNKTFRMVQSYNANGGGFNSRLTDSTTLQLLSTGSGTHNFYWEVVEYV